MAKKDKKTKTKKPEPKNKDKTKPRKKKGMRKKFFDVKIPLTATKVSLYSYSPEELDGSMIALDLTKNLRGKNLELKSKVFLNEGELTGELVSLKLLPTYIKRVMRRGTDYIEDSIQIESKDSLLLIKPFLITRKRVSRPVRTTIRNTTKKHLESKAKARTAEEIFSEIMSSKLQKDLSLKVKKIYPLALCEIREVKIIKKLEKKASTKKEEKIEDSKE